MYVWLQAANTNSALSKITNRLSFLKEKRNQMANELETVDESDNQPSLEISSPQNKLDSQSFNTHSDNKDQNTKR